jgi:hypothetical protein
MLSLLAYGTILSVSARLALGACECGYVDDKGHVWVSPAKYLSPCPTSCSGTKMNRNGIQPPTNAMITGY